MSTNYWVQWDPTNKKWIYSTNQGGTWNDLVENPSCQYVKGPTGIQALGLTDAYLRINEGGGFTSGVWFSTSDVKLYTGHLYLGTNGSAAGQINIFGTNADTTERIKIEGSNGHITAQELLGVLETHGGVLWNPNGITAATRIIVFYFPYAVTVTEARFLREDGSSFTVDFVKNNATYVCTARVTLTSASTWYTGTLSVTTFAAGDYLQIDLTTVAGSPTKVIFELTCKRS